MTRTLTAHFASAEAARNAHEDFIDTGFPSETVYLDRGNAELKVRTSAVNEPEIREILGRHQPSRIDVHETE